MLNARLKAIFVLLLATIVIMAVTVKNTPPVSESKSKGCDPPRPPRGFSTV